MDYQNENQITTNENIKTGLHANTVYIKKLSLVLFAKGKASVMELGLVQTSNLTCAEANSMSEILCLGSFA